MSTSNWVTNVGGGALAGATAGSAIFPGYGTAAGLIGGALGGALGIFGATEADKNDKLRKESEMVDDPATPYTVKLPSGATVTMYAHGPVKQKSYDPNLSAQSALSALGTTATLATKYKEGKGTTTTAAADKSVSPAATPTRVKGGEDLSVAAAYKKPKGLYDENLINPLYG